MRLQLQRELRWFMFDNARNGKPRELWNRALAQFIIFPIAFNADTLHLAGRQPNLSVHLQFC